MKFSTLKILVYIIFIGIGSLIYYENNFNDRITHSQKERQVVFEKYSPDKTLILSHRGSRYLLPENTILAFQTAMDLGADVIETDVRLTSDGELVMFHDKLVDRTTNGSGVVESHTLQELRYLDAGYRFSPDNGTSYPYRSKGIKIPTIWELFHKLSPDYQINIEIKEDDVVVAEKLWKAITEAMEGTGRKSRSLVIGCRFCAPTKRIRELAQQYANEKGLDRLPITTSGCEKEVTKFVILSQLYLAKIYYRFKPIDSFELLQIPTHSGAIRLDNEKVLSSAKHLGLHTHFWVINNVQEINRVLDLNVEGIISDRPERCIRIFKERGMKPQSQIIPQPLPNNSTGTYFQPTFDIEENHTCISLVCKLLQKSYHIAISLSLAFIVYRIFKKKY
ncbi:hypothetical protein DLAC_06220 [Tieghemostelium lacteum]|uniref:GP-PDE domain-containing protein n=1 Tax=Tieghemostelium lacteum TaxID=361077 RepID=A0A151ZHZ5_TIELA|nr:hypothetical protein DLAC_06220 [Tieghemostelium lacteum]|eukprot:KYQ93519.1 hypothetical protein DLAC_06220 [Tieghemostelium lacteum]